MQLNVVYCYSQKCISMYVYDIKKYVRNETVIKKLISIVQENKQTSFLKRLNTIQIHRDDCVRYAWFLNICDLLFLQKIKLKKKKPTT